MFYKKKNFFQFFIFELKFCIEISRLFFKNELNYPICCKSLLVKVKLQWKEVDERLLSRESVSIGGALLLYKLILRFVFVR